MKSVVSMKLANPKPKKNPYETNIEIINNLKHTLSKPTNVEAQRTLKILEKLIENISVFLYLDSDFVIKFNEISNPQKSKLNKALVQELSASTLELFVKEAKLESEFRPLNNSIEQQLRDGETVEEQRLADYNRIKKDMEMNFKTLVRELTKNKNDFEIVKSLKGTSALNSEVLQINESLGNYKIIMQKKLATAAEEEDMHTKILEELGAKIQSLEKSKGNCEQELQRLRDERSDHAEKKKEEIDKLKSEIRDVKTNKQKQLERIKKQSKQMAETLEKAHKAEQEKLLSSINQEKAKFVKLKEQNTKDEANLKTKKTSTEGTLQDNIATYDRQMQAQHKIKGDLQREFKRLSDQLNNFKKHFQEIEIERKREQQLIAAHKKRQELYELMERRKDEAATRIKRAYKMFKNKSKKKGKKKPKKK